jgi:hypothetical protein
MNVYGHLSFYHVSMLTYNINTCNGLYLFDRMTIKKYGNMLDGKRPIKELRCVWPMFVEVIARVDVQWKRG